MCLIIRKVEMTEGQENRPRRRGGCLRSCLIFFIIYFICSALLGWIMGDMFS